MTPKEQAQFEDGNSGRRADEGCFDGTEGFSGAGGHNSEHARAGSQRVSAVVAGLGEGA